MAKAPKRYQVGPPEQGAADLQKLLTDSVFAHHHSRDVFVDFVELTARSIAAIPRHVEAAATGTPFVEDTETAAAFARAEKRYGKAGVAVFGQAMGLVTLYGHEGQGSGHYDDLLGMAYEAMNLSNPGAGQFFTPMSVCRFMAQTQADGIEAQVHARIKDTLSRDAWGTAVTLAGLLCREPEDAERHLLDRVVPAVLASGIEPVSVMDPCCGSGRTLMAAAELVPRWMLDAGLVAFYGQDIDQTCVWMSRINLYLYGLRGGPMTVDGWRAYRDLARMLQPTPEAEPEAVEVAEPVAELVAASGDGAETSVPVTVPSSGPEVPQSPQDVPLPQSALRARVALDAHPATVQFTLGL